jgi:hypothetical protein
MKKLILIASISLLLLSACDDAKFNRYPGKKLDAIPQELFGVYCELDVKGKKKDKISIEKDNWSVYSKDVKIYLNDSNVISSYNGAYFYSTLNKDSLWNVCYIEPKGKILNFYLFTYDKVLPKEKNTILNYFYPKFNQDSTPFFIMDEEKLFRYSKNDLIKDKPLIRLKRN